MPRATRPTLTGRGRVLAFLGTAAALAGAGTVGAASASAATLAAPAAHTTAFGQAPVALTSARGPFNFAAQHAAASSPFNTPAVPAALASHHTAGPAVAGHPAAEQAAASAQPAQPSHRYTMYDSVTPSAIPAGHPIATYADGSFQVSPSQFSGRQVTWIDTNATDPRANVLDVEPGDATPSQAASWAHQRLSAQPSATAVIYTMKSDWSAAQASISTLPSWMQSHVKWWIADPTGTPHLVPGSSATQWYWGANYDISTVAPGF
jgi:hypothetical protein